MKLFSQSSIFWTLLLLSCFPGILFSQEDLEDDIDSDEELVGKVDPSHVEFWNAMQILETGAPSQAKKGREMLRSAADDEYVHAQYFTGMGYRFGHYGFKQSNKRAFSWFRLAAERGSPQAMHYLGQMYFFGMGTRQDYETAGEWFEKSLNEELVWEIIPPPIEYIDQLPSSAGTSVEEVETLDTVTDFNEATHEEILKSTSHYLLGLVLVDSEENEKAQKQLLISANYGVNGRAGNYGAAQKAAVNYAFGYGVEKDLEKANKLLELSKTLQSKSTMSLTHNLVKSKAIDEFAETDFQELMALVRDQEVQSFQSEVANMLADESSDDYDIHEAIKWYELAAESGNAWAHLKLAFVYWDGKLGERDERKAFEWFEKGEDKHALNSANAGICYLNGIGTEIDEVKAMVLFEDDINIHIVAYLGTIGKAPSTVQSFKECTDLCIEWAKRGDAHAQYLLGRRYRRGIGVKKNEKKALKYYKLAAAQNNGPALFQVGRMYDNKDYSEKNEIEAYKYYDLAAKFGYAPGAYSFAWKLDDRNDKNAALPHVLRCLELDPNHVNANNLAGVIYQEKLKGKRISTGKPRNLKKSKLYSYFTDIGLNLSPLHYESEKHPEELEEEFIEKMLYYYEKGDELNSEYASYNLGKLYYQGSYVEQDFEEAYLYFQTAAESGHNTSNYYLGQMHEHGRGVPVTYKDAAYYYRLAALDGHKKSLKILCSFYLSGKGVSRDLERAKFWLIRLANDGNFKALLAYGDVMLEEKQYEEARKFFYSMRNSGYSYVASGSCYRLSVIYQKGFGVKVDTKKAAKYRKKAIVKGNKSAMVAEGKILKKAENYEGAIEYLNMALEKGSPTASYELGGMYIQGKGLAVDKEKGWGMVRDAADAGYAKAKLTLAISTLKKKEGAPSLEEAIKYATEAENAAVPKASKVRRILEKRRSQEAVKETSSGGSQSG